MSKSIGRRATVNRTGNKSSGKVKAQQLVSERVFVAPAARGAVALQFPGLSISNGSKGVAVGVYLRTEEGKTTTFEATVEARGPDGKWNEVETVTWTVKDSWAIHGLFISGKRPIRGLRLRLRASGSRPGLSIWGYAAGPYGDLAPAVEKDIRAVDPEVVEEKLAQVLALIRKARFRYLETAYLQHAPNKLEGVTWAKLSSETVTCKYCSLCERLLPVTSFHSHSMFKSGYQLECKACKNCNINAKLNYKRTKQQLLESSLIRRELEYMAEENKFLREHPTFVRELFAKFKNRCFNCGTEVDRTTGCVDHTRPMVGLWPLDEHATLLCAQCNNEKHDKFPIEFYRDRDKLRELSKITGLPIADVMARKMNQRLLRQVLQDVPEWYEALKGYAATHEDFEKVEGIPDKSFRAVARRTKELEGIDLYAQYEKQAGRPFPGKR